MLLLYRRLLCFKCSSILPTSHHFSSTTDVYFSGIQPTGVPHIGNYFGFIQNWIHIQRTKPEALKLLAIVDLHAITVGFPEPKQFRENLLSTTAALLASGINPKETILFQQSDVLEHTQLFWILGSLQSITRLKRLPQYKDKSAQYKNSEVPIGLLCYPVLQASDVLLYKGTHVPVGEDQNQHMHVLRGLAGHFNVHFNCNYFPLPEMVLSKSPRIKSLSDPTKKMSKSDQSKWATLNITDPADLVHSKIKKAMSDFEPSISFDLEKRPAISNLITIYSAFTGKTLDAIVEESIGLNQAQFKQKVIEVAEETLRPIRTEYERLIQDRTHLEDVLREGSFQAREIAQKNIREIKQIIGFL